jgi:hypothetical protein
MISRCIVTSLLVLLLVCATFPSLYAQGLKPSAKAHVLEQTRHRYYALKEHGLLGFEAKVRPNFRLILTSVVTKSDSAESERLAEMLSAAEYHVSFDSDDQIIITHSPIDELAMIEFPRLDTALHKALQGFFSAWATLMYDPIFARPDSEYSILKRPHGYDISEAVPDGKIHYTLTNDFRFVSMNYQGLEHKADRRATYDSDSVGLLLKHLEENFDDFMHIKYEIQHMKVGAIPLPSFVHISDEYSGYHAQAEFVFSDYKLKTR